MVTGSLRKSAKISIPHFHCVSWHSTTDGKTATLMGELAVVYIGRFWRLLGMSDVSYTILRGGHGHVLHYQRRTQAPYHSRGGMLRLR